MIVIVPHPTQELLLIKAQKELIKKLFSPDTIIYCHLPLWIAADFDSVEKAKKEIKGISIFAPEYDEKENKIICPVEIQRESGCHKSKLPFIEIAEGSIKKEIPGDQKIFPLPLKIFRLGECNSPSPGFYELSKTVWKKL